MSEVLELACELISRASVTPDDAGCQALLGARLARAGFAIESLRFGQVDNLWASHGSGAPVLVLLGHTDGCRCSLGSCSGRVRFLNSGMCCGMCCGKIPM